MLKHFRTLIIMGLMLAITSSGFAQEAKTADELKAEREQLKTELKSKDVVKREDQIAKLNAKAPGTSSVTSIDGLVAAAAGIANTVVSTNQLLESFKREVTDSGNGEIDVTNHKAKFDDYVNLAAGLVLAGTQLAEASKQLPEVQKDVKSLSPVQAMPAGKSVKWSSEVLKLVGEELPLQVKLVNNLIATIKSSDNL
jgi:hypothetical protein